MESQTSSAYTFSYKPKSVQASYSTFYKVQHNTHISVQYLHEIARSAQILWVRKIECQESLAVLGARVFSKCEDLHRVSTYVTQLVLKRKIKICDISRMSF